MISLEDLFKTKITLKRSSIPKFVKKELCNYFKNVTFGKFVKNWLCTLSMNNEKTYIEPTKNHLIKFYPCSTFDIQEYDQKYDHIDFLISPQFDKKFGRKGFLSIGIAYRSPLTLHIYDMNNREFQWLYPNVAKYFRKSGCCNSSKIKSKFPDFYHFVINESPHKFQRFELIISSFGIKYDFNGNKFSSFGANYNLNGNNILKSSQKVCQLWYRIRKKCTVCDKKIEGKQWICGNCKTTKYCSRHCQKYHWKYGHKDICNRFVF